MEAEFHALLLPGGIKPGTGKIFFEFAQKLIEITRNLHADVALSSLNIDDSVYALNSATIDLCISLSSWTHFRNTKGAIKLHTLLDLHGNIPTFQHISDGKLHEVNVMDYLPPEAGSFYIMDRVYLDFDRLYRMHLCGIFVYLGQKATPSFIALRQVRLTESVE